MATYTYDPATDAGKVRLLIGDVLIGDANARVFSDEDIAALLSLESSDVRLAAAQALDSMASQEAMIQKVIRILDLSTNGAQTAAALRAHANELRRQVAEGSGAFEGLFDWAEMVNDDFAARERIVAQAERGQV